MEEGQSGQTDTRGPLGRVRAMITLPWRPSVMASLGVCAVVCIGTMYSLALYGDRYGVPEYPKIFTLPYHRSLGPPSPCRACREQINITFAKVHKAGGSTVSTILQRFGDVRNLSFVIPRARVSLGWPYQLRPTDYRPGLDGGFNLLVDHVLFNKTRIRSIMPRDTAYVTILRHPFEQLKSSFSWYEVPRKYRIHGEDPVREFLQQPAKYERNFRTRLPFRYTRDFMAYDLGFTNLTQAGNESVVSDFVRQVGSEFDLVLILEHLAESLKTKFEMAGLRSDVIGVRRGKAGWRPPERRVNGEMCPSQWKHALVVTSAVCVLLWVGMYNGGNTVYYPSGFSTQNSPRTPLPCRPCQEQTNLAFVKVHKAGGTTVTCLLQRFGDLRNLSFVLPRKGINLGWPKQMRRDILYWRQNKRNYQYKGTKLSPKQRRIHQKWSNVDYALYNHFNATLWKKIEAQGPDFWDEVRHFEALHNDVMHFCQSSRSVLKIRVGASRWNEEFYLSYN
ncbi:GAL3ST1 [Branchiostoma lanceolatum]|uniref:GAL3ST1 protein n=1 Tax=Branchiostoma lanceolatum TaxID=7740 RepID=A0A8K0AI29_BRALA|nr:GAL3ST1 [Branchiostoma lanceolatum]